MVSLLYAYRRVKKNPKKGIYVSDFQDALLRNQGYVYIAWLETTPFYKIGKSKNPHARFSETITLPYEIVIIHCIRTNYMDWLEKELHAKFESKKARGEWYRLTPEDLDALQSTVDRTYNLGEL